MKIKNLLLTIAIASLCFACTDVGNQPKSSLIPIPNKMEVKSSTFKINKDSRVSSNSDSSDDLAKLIYTRLDSNAETDKKDKQAINLILTEENSVGEDYTMEISSNGVTITSSNTQGLFYGIQSLFQLMDQNKNAAGEYILPQLKIEDVPRFAYRGMHLDVSRNFYSVDFVKKYIDILASYKMNRFHWHLTDGVGWRIEIKKYPELTRKAAFRTHKTWKEFVDGGKKFSVEGDENAYGGYYTQEQIKDVVAYAKERFITVIPEIEMPGHSEEVFVAYPDLCCSKQAYQNSGDFCAGNDKVFEFIDGVISEVIELFPSEYIHVGGDEASKGAWKKCPLCQKRMRTNGLKDVDELQSYFMKRVEAIVEAKGRKMIGWDEIIQGGLAESATVMSWRGEEGGIKAARQGNDVIMTPGSHCYFDGYQADPQTEPQAIGGYLPLRKVYNYKPMPKELEPEFQKHILGIQACLWTEYIATEEYLEYMLLPRMIALSEIAWSKEENQNWANFKHRLFDHFTVLETKGYNYYKPRYEIEMLTTVDQDKKHINVKFETEQDNPGIRYTTDGTIPTINSTLYNNEIIVDGAENLKAAIFDNGELKQPMLDKQVNYHKAIGAKVDYLTKWGAPYPAGGETGLVDGYRGGLGYGDGKWQGFTNDMDLVIDLGEVKKLNQLTATFMQLIAPGVYMPHFIEVETSVDGKTYEKGFKVENDIDPKRTELIFKDFKGDLKGVEARYIKFFAKNQSGYTFTDEIIVD